ncbi:hypothetical protein MPNT_320011 [Candidatus Methylacidithermus pantelleriae]|uniref:Transposase n=1 Tax=Candidatus Methylacidithermus pantelleriae TaxID=2744239 RepID=A0A8J2BTT2_9BACT|nr:hypothetical protein MPNT_320011 [Candidatus Methylacidithermus pantelleriae]
MDPFCLVTRCLAGAVGIDTNEDHLALAKTDPSGNLVKIGGIRSNLHGKNKEEATAIFARGCKKIGRALRTNRARGL